MVFDHTFLLQCFFSLINTSISELWIMPKRQASAFIGCHTTRISIHVASLFGAIWRTLFAVRSLKFWNNIIHFICKACASISIQTLQKVVLSFALHLRHDIATHSGKCIVMWPLFTKNNFTHHLKDIALRLQHPLLTNLVNNFANRCI